MKKYTVISTYPKNSSQNIGDQLITSSLIDLIKDVKGEDCVIESVWREDKWESVKEGILSSDAVLFACLAIRPEMDNKEYPYLERIIDSNVPIYVLASGTALGVSANQYNAADSVSTKSLSLLRKLCEKAVVFTTRGYLTQKFCEDIGMNKSIFSGDVAFYNKDNTTRFEPKNDISNIVISDPHKPKAYIGSFKRLYKGLKEMFPDANITIAQHGVNRVIDDFASEHGVKTCKIYEDRFSGLELYNNADLHVGYRVHAHVSALKRKKHSYLLEQDGRGADYGLTLNAKISVSNFIPKFNVFDIKAITNKLFDRSYTYAASEVPATMILSMIKRDFENGFNKFSVLDEQIDSFNINIRNAVSLLP